jgi:hypothetical protein
MRTRALLTGAFRVEGVDALVESRDHLLDRLFGTARLGLLHRVESGGDVDGRPSHRVA